MAQGITATGRYSLGATTADAADGRLPRFAGGAGPLTLGLLLPVLAIVLIEPAALRHVRFLTLFLLMPLFFLALFAYVYAVLSPGQVVGITLDAGQRRLELVQSNGFSTRHSALPFSDAVRFLHQRRYDDDGYAVEGVTLELRDGGMLKMPDGIALEQVRALNLMLGLGDRR